MSYKKVGGLHFIRVGRFGFSFFSSKRRSAATRLMEREIAFQVRNQYQWRDL